MKSLEDKIPFKGFKPLTAAEMERNLLRRSCQYDYRCKLECGSKDCYTWKEGQDKMAKRYHYGSNC